jgi:nucleotide-binding universal stress UspA family protein
MSWLPKQSVVVPVDFSESSSDAVAAGLELVEKRANLHVVHILLPLDYMSPGVVFETINEPSRIESTRKFCDEWLATHKFHGVTVHVETGDPGLAITEYAKTLRADLIVIPSHGYHGVKRLVLGSVAERVIRHADCPVLVLRRRDAQ